MSDSSPAFELRNVGTQIMALDRPDWLEGPWSAQKTFALHYPRLRQLHDGAPAGFVMATIHANRALHDARELPVRNAGDASTVIVGRHDQCSLHLGDDPGVALRHVMVRTSFVGGQRVLKVLDLKTSQGFRLDDAGLVESIVASGHAFIRLGKYLLMLFAAGDEPWSSSPDETWARLGTPKVLDLRDADAAAPRRLPPMPLLRREITVVTGTSQLGAPHTVGDLPPDTEATITVIGQRRRAVFALNAEQLDRGVLIGRYPRCDVETRGLLWDSVSRVHLLLIREEGRILAVDTGSSFGTFVDGEPIAAAVLGHEAEIQISPGNVVLWARVGEGSAIPIDWSKN